MKVCHSCCGCQYIIQAVSAPLKIIIVIVQAAHDALEGLKQKISRPLQEKQKLIALLQDIQVKKRSYEIICHNPISPLANRQALDLIDDEQDLKKLPPSIERLKKVLWEIVSEGAHIFYNKKLHPIVQEYSKPERTQELTDLAKKIVDPISLTLKGILENYTCSEIDHKAINAIVVSLMEYYQFTLSPNLEDILTHTLSDNAPLLADFLARQAFELLQKISFQKSTDLFGQIICEHVAALAQANAEVDDVVSFLKSPLQEKEKSEIGDNYEKCRTEISTKEEEAIFREKKLTQAFMSTNSCHPAAKEFARMTSADQKSMASEISVHFVGELFAFLTPAKIASSFFSQQPDGELQALFMKIQWPEELIATKEHIKKIISLILPEEMLKNDVLTFIESAALSFIENQLKLKLINMLPKFLFQATAPEKIRTFIVSHIFPLVEEEIFLATIKETLIDHSDQTAPLFFKWLERPQKAAKYKKLLSQLLLGLAPQSPPAPKLEKNLDDFLNFSKAIDPLLDDVYRILFTFRETKASEKNALLASLNDLLKNALDQARALYEPQNNLGSKARDSKAKKIILDMKHEFSKRENISKEIREAAQKALKQTTKEILLTVKDPAKDTNELCIRWLKCIQKNLPEYDLQEVKKTLKACDEPLKEIDRAAPPFGDMIYQVLFEIGGLEIGTELGKPGQIIDTFSKTNFIQKSLKEKAQFSALKKLKFFRDGYEEPLELLAEVLEPLQNRDALNAFFSRLTKNAPENDAEIDAQSEQLQIAKVASAFGRFLQAIAKNNVGRIGTIIASKAIFPNNERIQQIINKCLDKLQGNQIANISLLMRLSDASLSILREANNTYATA